MPAQPLEDELKSAQEGKNLLASMVVDLENQLEEAKAEKAEAYVDNSSLANEVRRLEGCLAEVTKERDTHVSDAANEKGVLMQSVDELKGQLDGLVFDRDSAEKARNRSEEGWRLERQNLEEQLRKSRKFNDDLNEQLATKEIEHARALAEKQEARHVSRSERQMRELFEGHLTEAKQHQDFLRTRMRELEAEAAEATKQYHNVGDTLYSLQDRCTELEQQKAALSKQATATENQLRSQVDELTRAMNNCQNENRQLKKSVEDVKQLLIEEKQNSARKTEQNASASANIVKYKQKLADSSLDETLLCQQVDQLKETVSLLSKEKEGLLQQKSGEKETYMEELRVLRQALTMAEQNTEAALTQVRTEKSQMSVDYQDLAAQLEQASAQVDSLGAQLETAETAVARALADKEELEGERRYLEEESRELSQSLAMSRADKESRDIEIAELQVLLRSQEVELQDDRGDLTRTKSDAAVMIRDQDEMRATFEKLRDENELLHAEVAQLNDHIQSVEVNNRRLEMEVGSAPDTRGLVGENERMRDRVIALEEELAQVIATKEVDRSILEEQLHHSEARAEKAELVDEIEDKLREALEEIARLESELVQTRAEAAERDIQWQAEVDALAETYEQLQHELKKRERDIEEMKEGAWLSAELQYMAKKVEDAEITERRHVGEQKEIIDKLEDKDATLALMGAKADEAAGAMRALEEELNDEKFTNKDLIREIGILREDLQRAEEEKDRALGAAEKFVERTVESTTADRETLKGALKELGNSLETIRSDKARALGERDDKISELNAQIHRLNKDLEAANVTNANLAKELELAQKTLKAAMASTASRFGQTIANYRDGLLTSGFKTWLHAHVHDKMLRDMGALKMELELVKNSGRMYAMRRIMGRWKNQALYTGWREWHGLWEETAEDRRFQHMLNNMTAAERKRALERLQMIIDAFKKESSRWMMTSWAQEVKDRKARDAKLKYAARQWYSRHMAMGFNTWVMYTRLSGEDRAQIEINELRWRLNRSLGSWMKDRFVYEAKLFSEGQKNRIFQYWKYHTQEVSKTTQRMKMMLGTLKRDKNRVAFTALKQAVSDARLASSAALDKKLLAAAKAKALMTINRVIQRAMKAQIAKGFNSWIEDRDEARLEKAAAQKAKELADAEQAGYDRAREQFEPDLIFLRDALRRQRAGAFAKFLDNFLVGNEKRGKMYCMGLWRSFTHGKAGRDEEERRKKELQDLKDALAAAEAEVQKYREQKAVDNAAIRKLEDEKEELKNQMIEAQRRLQMEVDMAKRNEAMAKENAQFEKEHAVLQITRLQKTIDEAALDAADKETIHQRSLTKNTQLVAELQVELNKEAEARSEVMNRFKELSHRTELDIEQLRHDLSASKGAESRLRNDYEVNMTSLKQLQAESAGVKAELSVYTSRVATAEAQRDDAKRELNKLKGELSKAEELLRSQHSK